MNCPRCQTENSAEALYCDQCGYSLGALCPSCGEPNRQGAKFCRNCGAGVQGETNLRWVDNAQSSLSPTHSIPKYLAEKILATRHFLEGERKQVTVLFADITSSTKLIEELDPEDARKLLDPALHVMMEAVHRYEGTVNQVLGDGIMALFGAPLAHEDHALRACYAALAMQEQMRKWSQRVERNRNVLLTIGVGLNSGEVLVRSISNDLNMDYSAVGHTTHLAARMEELAGAGSIVMTATTRREVEGFVQVRSLGSLQVKGVSRSMEAFELTGVTTVRRRLHAAAIRGFTPFVEREGVFELLGSLVERVNRGNGQVLALVGEAGVGKSRLVYEFVQRNLSTDWRVLEGAGASYGSAIPYFPLLPVVRNYFGVTEGEKANFVLAKVVQHLSTLNGRLNDAIPPLLALLDALPESEKDLVSDVPVQSDQRHNLMEAIKRFNGLEPRQKRRSTLEAMKRVFIRESENQPMLLIFEDLHWIDNETQAFLDGLVEGIGQARIFLLVNYRPGYSHVWADKSYYTRLRIDPLPSQDAEELLQILLGDSEELKPLKTLLIRRTEGNPFFLEESVRSLLETGVISGTKGAYRLAEKNLNVRIPSSVQTVLAARIDRLPLNAKRLLQTAAVIGVKVPLRLLRAVSDLSEEQCYQALSDLQAGEFILETSLFPELEYSFNHAITNEVVYGALLHENKTFLHARIAVALEEIAGENLQDFIETLARHAFRGELWDKAVTYTYQAGTKAMARSASREAVFFFERGLEALEKLPEGLKKSEAAVDFRLELRNALFFLGEFDRLSRYLEEAETIAKTLNDPYRLGRVLNFLVSYFGLSGQHDRALSTAERALALNTDIIELNAVTQYYMGLESHHVGQYHRSIQVLSRLIDSVSVGSYRHHRFGTATILSVICRTWLVQSLAAIGAFRDGISHAQEGIRIAEEAEQSYSLAYINCSLGLLYLLKGDFAEAINILEGCMNLSKQAEIRVLYPQIASYLGLGYALCGRFDDALPLMEKADRQSAAIGRKAGQPLRFAWHAQAHLLAGNLDEARALAKRARVLAEESQEEGNRAWALKFLGDVASSQAGRAERDEALRWYDRALTLSENLGMVPLQAHSHLALGKLLADHGDVEKARLETSTAIGLYEKLEVAYWRQQAEASLRAIQKK